MFGLRTVCCGRSESARFAVFKKGLCYVDFIVGLDAHARTQMLLGNPEGGSLVNPRRAPARAEPLTYEIQ